MKARLLDEHGNKTFAIIFDKGDEVMAGLLEFAKGHGLDAGHLTAIGGFSKATLGYFDRDRKQYTHIPIDEQVEVLSLVGDVALDKGQPKIHAHVVVGKANGTAWGGHILEAHVWPTLEVILVESPARLRRRSDPETGLALISVREQPS